jgi:hypothetical protein
MTEWDPARRRCRPTTEPHAVAAGRLSARTIAEAARSIGGPQTIGDAARPTDAATQTIGEAARPITDAAR